MKECREERTECQIFDFAQLLAALLVSDDEMLICILQLKFYTRLSKFFLSKIKVVLSVEYFFIFMAELRPDDFVITKQNGESI